MEVHLSLNRQQLNDALAAGRDLGPKNEMRGLNAPGDVVFLGQLGEAWDFVEDAILKAYIDTTETAREALHSAVEKIQDLISRAGERANDLAEGLKQKIEEMYRKLVSGLLSSMGSTFTIGGDQYKMRKFQLSQKLSIGSTWKAALTEVFEATLNGELSVMAEYEFQAE